MKTIQEQLKKSEAFFNVFKAEFEKSLLDEMENFYPVEKESADVAQLINAYAAQMFNMADSVVDKNKNYPEYRMDEEVEAMRKALSRIQEPLKNDEFFNCIHKRSKQLIVKYFKEIFNLSGDGFRVLELYSRLYTYEFVSALTKLFGR